MPLNPRMSEADMIKELMDAGKPQEQAVAIMMEKKKKKKKPDDKSESVESILEFLKADKDLPKKDQ